MLEVVENGDGGIEAKRGDSRTATWMTGATLNHFQIESDPPRLNSQASLGYIPRTTQSMNCVKNEFPVRWALGDALYQMIA
jgi:hypothetical protein